MKSNRIDVVEKLGRYIKFKKAFTFREALIITGATKEQLSSALNSLVIDGNLVLEFKDKSIMSQVYKVVPKRNKLEDKPYDAKLIKTAQSLCKMLMEHEEKTIRFIKLFNTADTQKDLFLKVLHSLCETQILTQMVFNKEYSVNQKRANVLLTFLKQKKYEDVQLILENEMPLICVQRPPNLPIILEVIIGNEVLKRDDLSKMASITRRNLTDWWPLLNKTGVVTHSFKEEPNQRLTYVFSSKRARAVLKAVNNGAYEKDRQLRQLWLKH